MGFVTGVVPVGKDATPVCMTGSGGVLVHNMGQGPLTLGDAAVTWEQGPVLGPGEKLWIPGNPQAFEGNSGTVVVGSAPPAVTPLILFACSLSGDGKIAYLAPG